MSTDDARELRDTNFQPGDMLSVAIFPKGTAGDPGGYGSGFGGSGSGGGGGGRGPRAQSWRLQGTNAGGSGGSGGVGRDRDEGGGRGRGRGRGRKVQNFGRDDRLDRLVASRGGRK